MMRRVRALLLPAIVAACTAATLASCVGGKSTPVATPVPAGDVSLAYVTFTGAPAEGGASDAKLFETKPGETSRLIRDYPGSGIVFLLASPDGRMIAFVDNGTMKIVDHATGDVVMTLGTPPISTSGAGPFASWSGDSKLFAYSRVNYTGTPIADVPNSARSGWIEIIDVASQEVITPAWTKVVPAAQPSWNPAGDEFVAVDFGIPGETNRPLIVGDAAKRQRTLTSIPTGNKGVPVWSSDGKHVVYWVLDSVANDKGDMVPGAIFIVNADGTDAHFLAQSTFPSPQAWSPDGKRLAVTCPPEGKTTGDGITHICVVDVDSGKSTSVTTGLGDFSASFSPDGDTIAYLSDRDPASGTFTLRTVRISDRHEEQIATGVPYGGYTWARDPM